MAHGKINVSWLRLIALALALQLVPSLKSQTTETWNSSGIGSTGLKGSAVLDDNNDRIIIKGAGANIAGSSDSAHFVYQDLPGDGQIIARISSLQGPSLALCGVMFRENLSSNSRAVSALYSATGEFLFSRRANTGSTTQTYRTQGMAPVWIKLLRIGNQFSSYHSADGKHWIFHASQVVALPFECKVGFVVCSRSKSTLATGTFEFAAITHGTVIDNSAPVISSSLNVTAKSDNAISLAWDHALDDIGVRKYQIYRNGSYISSTLSPFYTDNGLTPNASYSYKIRAYDAIGKASSYSKTVTAVTQLTTLQNPWNHRNIGSVKLTGNAVQTGNSFTITGTGEGLGNKSDSFHYVYQKFTGDCLITGKIEDLSSTANPLARVGFMMREKLEVSSRHASIVVTSKKGAFFERRIREEMDTHLTNLANTTIPSWVKLVRRGDLFSGYISSDGKKWILVGVETIPMEQTVFVGIPITNTGDLSLVQSKLSNVQVNALPTPMDGLEGVTSKKVVQSKVGSKYFETIGNWALAQDRTSLILLDRRGSISYSLTAPTPGVYQIELAARARRYLQSSTVLNFTVELDGNLLGDMNILSKDGASAKSQILTPWIGSGAHTVKLTWNNTSLGIGLEINSIRLISLQGPDSDGNGISDWAERQIMASNTVDVAPETSLTSPAFFEGKTKYLNLMSAGSSIALKHGAGDRWYANVPLPQTGTKSVLFSFETDALTIGKSVSWKPTNVLSEKNLTIRTGDSLLLTAEPEDIKPGSVTLEIVGLKTLTTTAGKPVSYRFDNDGTFTIKGTYAGATSQSRSITVNVVKSSFGKSQAAWVGRARSWKCWGIREGAVIEGDPMMRFIDLGSLEPYGRKIEVLIDKPISRYAVARLGQGGPIMSNIEIRGFDVISGADTELELIKKFNDGTNLYEMGVILVNPQPDVSFTLDIFVGGVTFDDGTITKKLNPSDFSKIGTTAIRFIQAPKSTTSTCHRMKAYQDTTWIGDR